MVFTEQRLLEPEDQRSTPRGGRQVKMEQLVMSPAPGERLLRFVGDRVRFSLRLPHGYPPGARAFLRTNIGNSSRMRQEIIATHAGRDPLSVAFWRDIPLQSLGHGVWFIELSLVDVGFWRAKAYMLDQNGRQHWPDGPDAGISVHPDSYRTGNTIYCAFTRMFGPNKPARRTQNEALEKELNDLDEKGYTVIPPSGKFRDLIGELDHIIGKLGCRVLHLLPVNPTPTTYARMGRFGSPYACEDLITVDPALVEFDQCTTGVEQFCELAHEVHRRDGRLILDIVLNHTGWGSRLQETHPEWFLRSADGAFACPGAWNVVWSDLVELDPKHVELWEEFAQAFLIWCRRGVDGFRCDAGYKVPLQVWQYVEARVRQEFPEALFILEGLGGPLEITENLLTEGGMQWAYSELFQNFTGPEVSQYLDYSLRQSERVGLYVHYSETHDNNRLASKGRAWSLMRNRLSALTSVNGGYGFTCGVEWLAPEKVNVHSSRGMNWGARNNLISELSLLNRLLSQHPCFFDGAILTRLSLPDSPVYAMRRDSAEGLDKVLVLVNTDLNDAHEFKLDEALFADLGMPAIDLLEQSPIKIKARMGNVVLMMPPAGAYCLAASQSPAGLNGDAYRRQRAQAAWAMMALAKALLPEQLGACDWRELARRVNDDPHRFLASLAYLDPIRAVADLPAALDAASGQFPNVVVWTLLDRRRITLVPPGHWLLIQDPRSFDITLIFADGTQEHARSIEVNGGHIAAIAPRDPSTAIDAELSCRRFGITSEHVRATVRFLAAGPAVSLTLSKPPADAVALLTNCRGGMARIRVDLGRIESKYDCALGANLNSDFPVDRHVFAKRVRVWINANGFITQVNQRNLVSFQIGPPAVWKFLADAGNGRTVSLELSADMLDGWNTTVFRFARPAEAGSAELPPEFSVYLIVRVDIEDRNFHCETHHNHDADQHFASNCHMLMDSQTGFVFAPDVTRQLQVFSDRGIYHPQPEWSQGLAHPIEQQRGQTGWGDAYSPGWFELPLKRGENVSLSLSADTLRPAMDLIQQTMSDRLVQNKVALARAKFPDGDLFERQLVLATRAFLAKRGDGNTIIAGYPWFLDWGRDSFIAARGLLAAGMVADVAELVILFGRFSENGTMPNTIHGEDASNRDTSDAPLWYGVVVEETAARMTENLYDVPVNSRGRTVLDVLRETAIGYRQGTPNGIRMDPESGLIWSPPHFTWMDTNYPACTPREGYPVEIQALWIRLLRQLERLKAAADGESWGSLADRAEASLKNYFWIEDHGVIADLLIAAAGQSASKAVVDNALRGNFLFAIVFKYFTGEQARRAVDAALRHLVVPGALRSLAPLPVSPPLENRGHDGHLLNNPLEPYWSRYEGEEDTRRKPAYHNGTAWTWTFPVFCEALAQAWDCSPPALAAARAYLSSMDKLMMSGCLGQIPEILDGDSPHQQRGCDAQAWGVTEALRVWAWLREDNATRQ